MALHRVLKVKLFGLQILMRLFMNPGDAILCEEYTYPHVPESLVLPVGNRSIGMEVDEFGIIPELLLATLERMQAAGEPIPRLLYTIPVGQNPTSESAAALCSLSRSRCRTHVGLQRTFGCSVDLFRECTIRG